MNNQAAQTMPAMTPERCSFFLRRFKNDEKMLGPNEQLALDYAIAALSQTAGVADGCALVPLDPTGDMLDAMLAPWLIGTKTQRECLTEGYRAMIVAAQSNDYASRCDTSDKYGAQPGSPEFDGADAFERYLRQTTQAAPAASGGECQHEWTTVGRGGVPKRELACMKCGRHRDHMPAPQPPPAASVSERARELRERAEAHGGGVFVSIGDIRAIEQALTQQRGDDVESAARALFEAQADPLAASWDRQWEPTKAYWRLVARGYHVNADGVLTQPAYVSVHCGLADFTDYFVKNYPGPDTIIHDPKWHAPRIFGAARRAIMASPEYAAATTPQPSADAVRELVERWRDEAEKIGLKEEMINSPEDYAGFLDAKTDELESLLSAASDHQQNAAQGGGEK